MARCGRTNLAGGGGVGSDETTATKDKVLKDYTYLGADTDDEIGTGTIESMEGTTVTPSASQQTVSTSGKYLTGDVIVSAVANLTAANIANGKVVGGTTGTYKGLGNATAAQVLAGKTFSTASLSNTTGTMKNYSGYTSTSNYTSGTFKSGTTGYIFVVPGGTGYYSDATYLRIPATNLAAGNIKKGVSILGITGTLNEGYWTSPLYLYNTGEWSNLQTTGMTITANNSGGYFNSSTLNNSSFSFLSFSCRQFVGATCMARFNQTVNISNYNYISAYGIGGYYSQYTIGLSTNQSVNSINSLAHKATITGSSDNLSPFTVILNTSSITGNFYVYLCAYCVTGRDSSGGYAQNYSKIWLSNS